MRQSIHITLRGRFNVTYTGTLILNDNLTSQIGLDDGPAFNSSTGDEQEYDQTGASYYVIAVVLVYGMSIVALIASHIKRRHDKITEDKQIDKYLQDFQIIKEVHARDTYRDLKKSVMNKINWDKKRETHRNLQQSILPLLAIGMRVGSATPSMCSSLESITEPPPGKGKRKVYPVGTRRHSDCHDDSDHPGLLESLDARSNRLVQEQVNDPGSLSVPNTYIGQGGSSSYHDARRLRFSRDSTSVLDRSLNSIAEAEEEERESQEATSRHRPSVTSLPEKTDSMYGGPGTTKLRRMGVTEPPVEIISRFAGHERSSLNLPPRVNPSSSTPAIIVSDDIWMMEMEGFNRTPNPYTRLAESPVSTHSLTVTFEDERPVSHLSWASSTTIDPQCSPTQTQRSPTTSKRNLVFSPSRSPNSPISSPISCSKPCRKNPTPSKSETLDLTIQEANPLQITCV